MNEKRRKTRVLLVDDEVEFLDATARALSRRGFEVQRAEHGEIALRLLEERQTEVAVLDVKMPGMDGVDIFREIKLRWPHVPVILLTGHGTVNQAFTSSKEGVFDYLIKPCDIEKLADVVRKAVVNVRDARRMTKEREVQAPMKLLIVDDEQEFLDSMTKVLSRRDVEVTTANSGLQAVDILQGSRFSVALLDVKMPGMNGFELAREINRLQPLTEVIFLTGHPSVDLAVAAVKEGAFDYLVKPADINDLIDKIADAHIRHLNRAHEHQSKMVDAILERLPD